MSTQSISMSAGLEDARAAPCDLGTDAVAGQEHDLVGTHGVSSGGRGCSPAP